jgi:CDP-glucose 4,6-dehydratase
LNPITRPFLELRLHLLQSMVREDYSLTMDLKLGDQLRALPGPILITGHTGFKGAWLIFLLEYLGIPCVGYSLAPEEDSLYDRAKLEGKIPEIYADIRDFSIFGEFLNLHRPSAIIHMAAQPLVLQSYKTPRDTFDVNVMGTVNVLDAAFATDFVQVVIVVTTDKVYRNDNSGRAFIETDPLEGKDPYSASKVGAEAAVAAWQQIQKISGGPKVVSVRAGNVIGGGDWAENRLLPDLVRGFISGKPIEIRNPENTRPWQHVLEPLVGYLMILEYVLRGGAVSSINFAPNGESLSVREVANIAQESWGTSSRVQFSDEGLCDQLEASSLALNASLSGKLLGAHGCWNQNEAIQKTISWWQRYIENGRSPHENMLIDISDYLEKWIVEK